MDARISMQCDGPAPTKPDRPCAAASAHPANPLPLPPMPTSLIDLILATLPKVSPEPTPTYLLALMVVPPSVVPLAFESLLWAANRVLPFTTTPSTPAAARGPASSHPLSREDARLVDPWLCVSRLACARPSPENTRLFTLALKVIVARCDQLQVPTLERETIGDRLVASLCMAGNLERLQQCHAMGLFDSLMANDHFRYMAAASEGGCTNVLKWWVTSVPNPPTTGGGQLWLSFVLDALHAACRSGSIATVDWWLKHDLLSNQNLTNIFLPESMYWISMCQSGSVELLNHVMFTLGCSFCDDDNQDMLMDAASAKGHVAVLDWLLVNSQEPNYTHLAMDTASANGHLHVLDWWVRSGLPFKFTPVGRMDAEKAGHVAVVEWWNSFPLYRTLACGALLPNRSVANVHTKDLVTLASFGRLEWIEQLTGVTKSVVTSYTPSITFCQMAARFGHAHVLHEFVNRVYEQDDLDICLHSAAAGNHVGVWSLLTDIMYDGYTDDPNLSGTWLSCILAAAENGSLDILHVILLNPKTRPSARDWPHVILAACTGGHSSVLQYLIDNKHWTASLSSSSEQQQRALQTAAEYGHVAVLKWWYRQAHRNAFVVFSAAWVESLVGAACAKGHAKVLAWILKKFGAKSFHVPFGAALMAGVSRNKEVMEWLLAAHGEGRVTLPAAILQYFEMALRA